MKKNLNKYLTMLITTSLTFGSCISSVSVFAAPSDWIKGWTGSANSSDFKFNNETASSVQIENTKVNNGKFTDEEDSIIYYAQEVAIDSDFVLSATISIDEYNTMSESSNPNQGSFGIAVLDDLYNKSDSKKYTNGVFLGSWAKNKNDDLAFYSMYREGEQGKTISSEVLSEKFANTGEKLGEYNLTIKKSGTVYTLICDDNSTTIDMSGMSESIYPCLYIARNAKVTFSNIKLEIESRKVTEIKVDGEPRTDFTYGEKFNIGDAKVTVIYDDGSTEIIEDYAVKNFNPKSTGKQNITLVKGNAKFNYTINVNPIKCVELNVEYQPVKTIYYEGTCFKSDGLKVVAKYNNGTSEVLDPSQYTLTINGNTLKDGDLLSSVGTASVKVTRNDETGISGAGVSAKFNLTVKNDNLIGLKITQNPKKTVYYIGDEFDSTGLRVSAVYSDDTEELLKNTDYTITGFDSAGAGDKVIKINYIKGDVESAELNLTVNERKAVGIEITTYPKTTYQVGEEFDNDDMEVAIKYDNGDLVPTTEFKIDKSQFDTSKVGTTSVSIIPSNSEFAEVKLNISVVNEISHAWRKAIFGQSASTEKESTGSAGVTATNYGTVDGTINVRAWDATGKITADHDGIVYYYTRVNGENNFTVSADITVNKYLEHDNDDTKRNGQEAFGIMARDIVPLLDENGKVTTDYASAKKDAYGVPVTQEKSAVFASNIAIAGGFSGTGWPTDTSSASYEKQTKLNKINLFVRSGVQATDGGGTKIGPNAISDTFPKEGNKYRVTLKRVNGGVYAKCYDYSNGVTKESYIPQDDLFTTQNSKDIYVGFFGARWADIDVSNVKFYESIRATDQTMTDNSVSVKTPSMMITSSKYSATSNYTLEFQPLDSKGTATIRVNNKVAVQDMPVKSGTNTVNLTIDKNTKNDITITYTPDDTLALTSYDDIIIRQEVTHKDFDKTQANVYVSPDGNINGDGTEQNPYDIDTAIGFLSAGQTIIMQEGTYKRTEPIEIELGNNGTENAVKSIIANGKVIIDCQKLSAGAIVTGNYWHIKGLEFINSGDNLKGFHLGGSNCVIEDCSFHDNGDIGLQISRTYSTNDYSLWPSNNLILNCESYNNCDPSMINADGFGAKLTVGDGNIFRNCKSHHNVDDGWDLYTKVNSGPIGYVTIENCVSFKNGYRLLPDGTEEPYGAGGQNGFKLGGENVGVAHILKNCISYENGSNGITTNSNPCLKLYNVVSFNNENANFRLYSDKPAEYNYTMDNCASFNCGENESDVIGTVNRDNDYTNNSGDTLVEDGNFIITKVGGASVNGSGVELTENMLKDKLQDVINAGNINLTIK